MSSPLLLPKGYSDFQLLRQSKYRYVDKTLLVEHILNDPAQIILLPRPRRFGKTLNLSMLRYFFEKHSEDRRALFTGLKIEQREEAQKHFQRYPTIFVTFKDIKAHSWKECIRQIRILLGELYQEHVHVLHHGALLKDEQMQFQLILNAHTPVLDETMLVPDLANSLRVLCKHLHAMHGERVVLLIDEYDTPIHEAYAKGYYNEAISFFRNLLSAALKDNAHVFRGVMTGILRIARESTFSGLNNLGVYSVLSQRYSECFGFTEDEVSFLAEQMGLAESLKEIRSWYNGYLFGDQVIYNPWSVIHYLSEPKDGFHPYWMNSSNNTLVHDLVLAGPHDLKPECEQLLRGECIAKPIYENIAMPEMKNNSDMIWSLLLFSGYLKPQKVYTVENDLWAKMTVPNREVRIALAQMTRTWFATSLGGASSQVQRLLHAVLCGEERELRYELQEALKRNVSFYDSHERFFHGFVLGLLVNLSETHDVHSNRESGFGRCDVLVIPKRAGKPGVVLEFKVADTEYDETIERALKSALKQLRERDYASTLRERGANPIYEIAIAFEGKQVEVKVLDKTKATIASKKKTTRAMPKKSAQRKGTKKRK